MSDHAHNEHNTRNVHENGVKETNVTRRRALQIAFVTGGGVFAGSLLQACGGYNDPSTQSAPSLTPTPRHETVVVDQVQYTIYDSFNSYIPNGVEASAGFQQICREYLFYNNLVTGEIIPWLGKSWKYNADRTELTIELNPKVKWNDGKPFTSKDIKFTIDMLIGNSALAGGDHFRKFTQEVATPDEHTVIFRLKERNPRFHYPFICGIGSGREILPEHIWSKQDPMTFKDNPPVRTGPYVFDRSIPNQSMFIWKKNPDYWNKDEFDPQPKYVVYRSAPTPDSEIEQFRRAQIDSTAAFTYTHGESIKNSGYKNIEIVTKFRDPCPRSFAINCDPSKGLLSDPRMHWAISYLVDRKTLGETVWTPPTPPAQYPWADYPGNEKWSNKEVESKYALTYDPQKAASLLDEMGAKAGNDGKRSYQGQALQYEVMTSAKAGEAEYINGQKLAEELTKIGIESTVRYYAGSVWTNKLNNGEYDISTYYLCGNVYDPGQLYTIFETHKSKPIGQNASTDGNTYRAQYQELNDLAVQLDSVDPEDPKNKELFDKALEAYYKYLPAIPVYQTTYPATFNTTYWTGWPTDTDLYQVPANWWGQFLLVIGKLKPTGKQ